MANGKLAQKEIMDLVEKLSNLRKEQVLSTVKVDKLMDKKRVQELAMKRIEASHINDVERSKDSAGKPLLTTEWSKKAAVEERLSKDEKFTKLLKQYRLTLKGITRATVKSSNLEIAITELETKEKILLTV